MSRIEARHIVLTDESPLDIVPSSFIHQVQSTRLVQKARHHNTGQF
jgi:hypothetical protein